MNNKIYDFLAIGLGPFNLSLACLSENIPNLSGLFLEKKKQFDWHPGMMLNESTLQTPFLSDLVTMADPTHHLSFLNYAKLSGRLYSFYIKENFFLMRKEYNQYCQWAAKQLSNIRFSTEVIDIRFDEFAKRYEILTTDGHSQTTYLSKKIILGTGPQTYIPDCCLKLKEHTIHSSQYLPRKQEIQTKRTVTVVGSGQSAAEIFHDLLQDIDLFNYQLNWITRSPRYFPLEYTKLTLEMTSPEYVDYFFDLPLSTKMKLLSEQKHLYKGINSQLINQIYDLLYQKQLDNSIDVNLVSNASLNEVEKADNRNSLKLSFHHHEQLQDFSIVTDQLILATGYQYILPDFIHNIASRIQWDKEGRFAVHRNYSVDKRRSEIFVQNAELHTHGFVTPDLGMACYRSSYLIKELIGYEYYPIEKQTSFQHFGIPKITPLSTETVKPKASDSWHACGAK